MGLDNRVRDLEARVKKLENWKLVHTSMKEERENANHKQRIAEIFSQLLMPANNMTFPRLVVNKPQILRASFQDAVEKTRY